MASNTPGAHPESFRHRITNIRLDPSTADHDLTLKVLVDGHEVHRLPLIKRGALLSWNEVLPCNVISSSRVEIRMYNKRTFTAKRVGTLEYSVSTIAGQAETRIEFVPNWFTAVLTFPTPDDVKNALAAALSKAQETTTKTRPLEKLGGTRDAFEMIIKFGQAVSQLHPAAQAAFGICTEAWKVLEKQEECDANVERLVIGLADLLPAAERVGNAATSPQLKNVAKLMMDLIEDASRFVIKYRSDGGFGEHPRTPNGM
ncbi:hypothetical protein BDV93DRAFT_509508 [Ceratobasidium sp. AG-I]|nr:hypothetical protein BDV93DRAFT_509508 [Ceratobasidium sp. AG-I]